MRRSVTHSQELPMSAKIPEVWSIESATEYVWGVQASLAADPGLTQLVADWDGFESKLEAERVTRNSARKTAIRAAAVQRVADAGWDATLDRVGDWTFFASGRDSKAPPYSAVFDLAPPSQAKRFGAAKATAFGARVVSKLRTFDPTATADLVKEMESANATLAAAAAERSRAALEAQSHDLRRRALLAELQGLCDQAEIAILMAHPGENARVQAILRVRKDAGSIDRDPADGSSEEPLPSPTA
jgi:hypothetical protein